jgi:hypothetical protein
MEEEVFQNANVAESGVKRFDFPMRTGIDPSAFTKIRSCRVDSASTEAWCAVQNFWDRKQNRKWRRYVVCLVPYLRSMAACSQNASCHFFNLI